MKENTHENNLDELTAGLAKLREEISTLAADLKRFSAGADEPHGRWAGFQNRIEEAGERGGKVIKGFAHEVERHPLIGGIALFGIGFMLATLLFKRSHPHHAP